MKLHEGYYNSTCGGNQAYFAGLDIQSKNAGYGCRYLRADINDIAAATLLNFGGCGGERIVKSFRLDLVAQ